MNLEDLTPEQQAKARACKTPEELLAMAKAEGQELSEEQLEQIAGGGGWDKAPDLPTTYEVKCPHCGHTAGELTEEERNTKTEMLCKHCGRIFNLW